ncbi:MAG TPA: VWA domain-containing protein [Thermoanaerobaculia bacterium]|nr:VWA domain-containing protein [Thermoanaerobaculia bacterium]
MRNTKIFERIAPPLLVLALLTFAAAPAALAQEERPRGEFEGEVDVTEVLLDVVVTDRQGNVIVGLEPEDFRVREDGREVPVESVVFYSSSEPLESAEEMAARGIDVDRVPEDRYFILFVDNVQKYSATRLDLVQQQLRAGQDAAEWVRRLPPADWVAVVGFDRKLEIHADFTRDKEAAAAAVRRAVSGKEGSANWPSRQKSADAAGPSLTDDLPSGRALLRATPRVYDALELTAEAVDDVVGRKNLIYFGIGFGELDGFGQYRRDERYYPDMIQALNDANVAVYPLDVAPSGADHPFEDALSGLAHDTGGRYLPFFTSFETPLNEITREAGGYYLLAYRATHPAGDSGFQRVEVSLDDPKLQVRARRGYLYGGE